VARGDKIRLDLNSPAFQDVFSRLTVIELTQVVASLRRLRELEWDTLYPQTGFQWAHISHLPGPEGGKVYSLRLSQKIRAISCRDGDFLRLVSLHPDHDSAYDP
jgi:hypothetical protein